MLVKLVMPGMGTSDDRIRIRTIYAVEGGRLALGARVMDVQIDLSAATPHDCPPISTYLISIRERLWLHKLFVRPGDEVSTDATIALFGTEESFDDSEPAQRSARIAVVGITSDPDWWNASLP